MFCSPLTANVYFPAIPTKRVHSTKAASWRFLIAFNLLMARYININLTVTVYMIVQGLGECSKSETRMNSTSLSSICMGFYSWPQRPKAIIYSLSFDSPAIMCRVGLSSDLRLLVACRPSVRASCWFWEHRSLLWAQHSQITLLFIYVAIAAGVIANIVPAEERGGYTGIATIGPSVSTLFSLVVIGQNA